MSLQDNMVTRGKIEGERLKLYEWRCKRIRNS